MTNDTHVKSSLVTHAYKVVRTHAHEISVWKILSILLNSHAPHCGELNGGVRYDLATLVFKNGEQLEYFYSIIFRLQRENIFSGETVSPTRLVL